MPKSIAELFIQEAIKTESVDFVAISQRLSEKRTIRLLHAALGLSTEANEFLDALKKWIFYGKELDEVNLAEELGDSFWYQAIACDELGKSFEEIQVAVIQKLRKRYLEKFSSSEALTRDLSAERNELELNLEAKDIRGEGFTPLHFCKGMFMRVCGAVKGSYTNNLDAVTCENCLKAAKVNYGKQNETSL